MKIEREKMTICDTMDRIVEKEEGFTCGCENPKLKIMFHIDGFASYINQYSCACGNYITMECERDEDDLI